MSGGERSSERVLVVPGPSLPVQCLRGQLSLLGSLRTPSHPWAATRKAGEKVSAAWGVPKIRTGISEPGVGRERSAA